MQHNHKSEVQKWGNIVFRKKLERKVVPNYCENMSSITRDFFSSEYSNQTCTGFDPRKIYMLGQKYSGIKPRGVLQNYKLLKNYYLQKGTFFEDPQFSLDAMKMGDQWESMKNEVRWLRPKEIVAHPKFIMDGTHRFDVNQGELGDCWFLAAVADVAQNHTLMELIVPPDQSFDKDYCGLFHFRFWQYGRWIDIVIDDRLPTHNGKLIFLQSSQQSEFWSPLLEKAYAKLYCSYRNIEGGFTSEALQDLTGGLTEIYAELTKLNGSVNFFDMMMTSYAKKSFMGCAITNTTVLEGHRPDGLYSRHAYSITCVTEVTDKHGGNNFKLVRIRNPWGRYEWKGNWSDNSTSWDLLSEEIRHNLLVKKDDGEFWIEYGDFVTTYTLLEFCHPNPDSIRMAQEEMRHWTSFMIDGGWSSKVTNGGLPKDKDFSKNPQYLMTINGPQNNREYRILIGLMQKDRRIHNLPTLCVGFLIYRLPDSTTEGRRLDSKFLEQNKPIYVRNSESSKQITGHVDFLNGSYCIIPFTTDKNTNCDFLLRVYSEVPFNVLENDEVVGILPNKSGSIMSSSSTQGADSAIKEVFNSISGGDDQISWKELKSIFDLLLKSEKKEFSKEMCRSMVAMLDSDRSGMLNLHEFLQLWEMVGLWRGIFKNFDKDHSETISGPELREAFKDAKIQVNSRILNMLILRYGNEKREMEIDDFLHCCIKLTTMIQTYEANYSETGKLENWIIDTVYT